MDPYRPYRDRRQEEEDNASGAGGARSRPSYQRDFERFERGLRALQIEFEKFFNGALPQPPEDHRQRLADELRRLRNLPQMSSADSFRLGGLEARFNTYNELFNRRIRDQEEGRSQAAARSAPAAPRFDPEAGVTVRDRIDPEAVEALFAGLCRGADPPRFDLDTFGRFLEKQLDQIRTKTGGAAVQFRVEREGSQVRLKAKPIRD
ncbi:MAG: hypothetical protein KDD11_15115 [Acidobacteria bacterium]|nr:hypothetical protein [Acidobacteriota bacterium]